MKLLGSKGEPRWDQVVDKVNTKNVLQGLFLLREWAWYT